jgi:Na+/melibiose symporter-like transporter
MAGRSRYAVAVWTVFSGSLAIVASDLISKKPAIDVWIVYANLLVASFAVVMTVSAEGWRQRAFNLGSLITSVICALVFLTADPGPARVVVLLLFVGIGLQFIPGLTKRRLLAGEAILGIPRPGIPSLTP